MRRSLTIILAIIASVTLLMGCSCGPKAACPQVGSKAPNFTLTTPDGQSVSLSDFQGKTVMLNFWSIRCAPCVAEMPLFQTVYDVYSKQGLTILAINITDPAAAVKEFTTIKKITLPVLLDTKMEVFTKKYCLPQAVPITLFINREGIIKNVKFGQFESQKEIETILNSCN